MFFVKYGIIMLRYRLSSNEKLKRASEMDKQQEISVPEVLRRLRANAIWILLAGVIFCIGSIVITKLFITPVYESTASVYVYTNPDAQSEGRSVFPLEQLARTESLPVRSGT